MPTHAKLVCQLAADVQLTERLQKEVACMAIHLNESPAEVLAEALSELRSLRGVACDDLDCGCVSAACNHDV